MSDDAHMIDIDAIVLMGVDHFPADRLRALTAAAVRRALTGTAAVPELAAAPAETGVAGQVARSVVHAVRARGA